MSHDMGGGIWQPFEEKPPPELPGLFDCAEAVLGQEGATPTSLRGRLGCHFPAGRGAEVLCPAGGGGEAVSQGRHRRQPHRLRRHHAPKPSALYVRGRPFTQIFKYALPPVMKGNRDRPGHRWADRSGGPQTGWSPNPPAIPMRSPSRERVPGVVFDAVGARHSTRGSLGTSVITLVTRVSLVASPSLSGHRASPQKRWLCMQTNRSGSCLAPPNCSGRFALRCRPVDANYVRAPWARRT